LGAEAFVVGAAEVGAEVFAGVACGEVGAQQALDGFGAIFGGGAEADLAGDGGVLADGSADAEVEGVDHDAVLLIFLPSRPMSAIQLWPQELVHPVTCSLIC